MVYKIRVILDTKEDIFRDIEIKDKQTLWNLHLGIKSAFNLQGEELSVFNLIEDDGTITKTVNLEDMSDEGDEEIMSDIYLSEAFTKVGDKTHFQYGFLDLWEFFCELIEIVDEKNAVQYPITIFRFGNVPLKAPGKSVASKPKKSSLSMMDEDFGFDEFENANFSDEDDYEDEEEMDGYSDDFFDED
jgi:hypothetical protein